MFSKHRFYDSNIGVFLLLYFNKKKTIFLNVCFLYFVIFFRLFHLWLFLLMKQNIHRLKQPWTFFFFHKISQWTNWILNLFTNSFHLLEHYMSSLPLVLSNELPEAFHRSFIFLIIIIFDIFCDDKHQ